MEEKDNKLLGSFEYNTDLFKSETIRQMVGHFTQLCEAVVKSPDQAIGSYQMITEEESQQLALWSQWNNTKGHYSTEHDNKTLTALSIHQWFEKQVEDAPNATALTFANEHITYSELNQKANSFAHHLLQKNVKRGDLVGICVERSINMMVALLGILKAGAAYVPLDPKYPLKRLNTMAEDSQITCLICDNISILLWNDYSGDMVNIEDTWSQIIESPANLPHMGLLGSSSLCHLYLWLNRNTKRGLCHPQKCV